VYHVSKYIPSSARPQDSLIHGLVEQVIGPEQWERLIEPKRWDPTDDVEARIYGLYYRAVLGWTALPAAQPVWRDDEVICSCRKGEWCLTPGKHPFGAWNEEILPTAPSVEETIRRFRNDPRTVAVLCGQRSGGLVVGDVDPRHNGRLQTLWDFGWPQDTPTELTGGCGYHVYVHADDLPSAPTYAEGVEVKGDGALVISTPSLHSSGNRYAWLPGHAPWEVSLAELPAEVVADIRQPARTTSHTVEGDGSEPNWYYAPEETARMVTNLLNKAIRDTAFDHPDREHRNNMAVKLGFQLGSMGLSDDEVAAIGALYEEAVRGE
jgi:hypothetical protein